MSMMTMRMGRDKMRQVLWIFVVIMGLTYVATAGAFSATQGHFYVLSDGRVTLKLNGDVVSVKNNMSTLLLLRDGDIVTVRMANRTIYQHIKVAFISDDQKS